MTKNISQIVERIKSELTLKEDKDVAEALAMTPTALYNHKMRGSIPYKSLSTFCEKEGLSLDWLLTGEGPMRRGEKKEALQIAKECATYNVSDPEMAEIIQMLKEFPQDKALVLKLLKGKKDIKEALEGFEISNIKEQEG